MATRTFFCDTSTKRRALSFPQTTRRTPSAETAMWVMAGATRGMKPGLLAVGVPEHHHALLAARQHQIAVCRRQDAREGMWVPVQRHAHRLRSIVEIAATG